MHSIGKVVSVSYDKLIFEVADFGKLNYNFSGFTYIARGVVDYVTIVDDTNQRFIYQVVKAEDKEQFLSKEENSKLDYVGRFECVPIGMIKINKIEFNMEFYPFLQNKVYLTSEEDYKIIFSMSDSNKSINLGLIDKKYNAKIELSKIFNHHSAILGNTGSGKSTTIRQIISETKKHDTTNLHLHVFDVHGEYGQIDEKTCIVDVLSEYKISLKSLDLQDWINLVKPSDLVQLPILQTSLKLSNVIRNNNVSEIWLKCFLAYTLYTSVQTDAVAKRTKVVNLLNGTGIDTSGYNAQYANFQGQGEQQFLTSLVQEMENQHSGREDYDFLHEQLEASEYTASSFEDLLKALEYSFLLEECKGNTQARAHCGTLETRVKSIQMRYSTLLSSTEETGNSSNKQIIVYSVSELDDDLLLFFSSHLLKKVFEMNKKREISEREINVFILEEAHRFISKSRENSSLQEIERFKKVAREGRKFGCFLFLSSQRPSELSSTVLSQCNNYLIHRIKNNFDLDYMLKTIPYIDKNQLTRFSYLPTGVAYIVGELFPIPIEVTIIDHLDIRISMTPGIKY
jgi:hypothetical protein